MNGCLILLLLLFCNCNSQEEGDIPVVIPSYARNRNSNTCSCKNVYEQECNEKKEDTSCNRAFGPFTNTGSCQCDER